MANNDDENGWSTPARPGVKATEEYTPEETTEDEEDTPKGALEVVVEGEHEEEDAPKKPVEKPGRAEKRIRQLARGKREVEAKLSEAQQEIANLRKGNIAIQRTEADRSVGQYTTLINAKTAELKQAKITGDLDAEMRIDSELRDLTISKRIAEATKEKLSTAATEETTTETRQQQQPNNTGRPDRSTLPEKTQEWLEENPWFDKNRKMQAYSAEYANDLLAEGLTFEEDEFYTKMDEEMRKRFPDEFVNSGDDGVQSKNTTSSSATQDVKRRQQSQVVPGSSRTPVVKRGREVLSKEEAATADRLGISRERYAARKKATRDNKEATGWTTIGRAK